jgi:hypothetical protein
MNQDEYYARFKVLDRLQFGDLTSFVFGIHKHGDGNKELRVDLTYNGLVWPGQSLRFFFWGVEGLTFFGGINNWINANHLLIWPSTDPQSVKHPCYYVTDDKGETFALTCKSFSFVEIGDEKL